MNGEKCGGLVESQPMTDGGLSEMEQRQRRARLISLVGVGVVGVVGYVMLLVAGDRQVTERVEDLRQELSTANVDPSLLALSLSGSDPDPLAAALGAEGYVTLQQVAGDTWCVETEVAALLSTETLFFLIDEDGRFAETSGCG